MKPELPWMGVLSVIRIFSFLNVRDWPVKCKCTNIISLLTAIITLNTFYEKVFMQDQVDMFCERCCSQSPSCNKLELCLKEMNFTDSQFRICSAKIVPLPHIGCREHWLASLSFMTNPITSFNIPPAHDPTSLWGPLWGQVLLIVLSYEIHFLLNAEAAIWFFFFFVLLLLFCHFSLRRNAGPQGARLSALQWSVYHSRPVLVFKKNKTATKINLCVLPRNDYSLLLLFINTLGENRVLRDRWGYFFMFTSF